MLAPISFDYAVIRVVPRVEREEFVNAGVIVFCLQHRFLEARVHINDQRLRALWSELNIDLVRSHLEAFPRICAADPTAGPIFSTQPARALPLARLSPASDIPLRGREVFSANCHHILSTNRRITCSQRIVQID